MELTATRDEKALFLWENIRQTIERRVGGRGRGHIPAGGIELTAVLVVPLIVISLFIGIYQSTGQLVWSLLVAVVVLLLLSASMLISVGRRYPRVKLVRSHEDCGFWRRNWERIIVAVVSAIVGAMVYGVTDHVLT